MSDAIYPTLPGLTWPVKRTPMWKTHISTTPSGREWRAALMNTPRYRYTLSYEFLRNEAAFQEFQTLFGFFNARQGSYDSFLFNDLSDNTAAAQQFGLGNGTTTQFQLQRSLGGAAQPVHSLAGVPAVRLGGVLANLMPDNSFEVDTNADGVADGWSSESQGSVSAVVFSRNTSAPSDGSFEQAADANFGATGIGNRIGIEKTVQFNHDLTLPVAVSVAVRSGGPVNAVIYVEFRNVAGGIISVDTLLDIAAPGAATRVGGITGTPPAGARMITVHLWCYATTPGAGSIRWDGVMLKLGEADFSNAGARWYSVSTTGEVAFNLAPAAAAALTWAGSYYWRCRFDADELTFEQFMQQFWKTGEVRLITVKP